MAPRPGGHRDRSSGARGVADRSDLATGAGVDDLAAPRRPRRRACPTSPATSPVECAACSTHRACKAAVATDSYWREVFVAVPVGDRVLEGFIDLLYEGADGRARRRRLQDRRRARRGRRGRSGRPLSAAGGGLRGCGATLARSRRSTRCVFLFAGRPGASNASSPTWRDACARSRRCVVRLSALLRRDAAGPQV